MPLIKPGPRCAYALSAWAIIDAVRAGRLHLLPYHTFIGGIGLAREICPGLNAMCQNTLDGARLRMDMLALCSSGDEDGARDYYYCSADDGDEETVEEDVVDDEAPVGCTCCTITRGR